MTNHNINVLKTFFDFYVITALDVFCGEKTLNHANKSRRISETCTQVVEELYQMILSSLQYAVIREFRHLNERSFSGRSAKQRKLSRVIKLLYKVNKNGMFGEYEDIPEKYKHQKQFLSQALKLPIPWTFNELADAFEKVSWEDKYGGKKWAKAAKMLLGLPKNHDEK